MDIPLNSIFNLTESQIRNSRVELNIKDGATEQPFIDHWLECSEKDRNTGAPHVTSYWPWSKNEKKQLLHEGEYAFSFIRLSHEGRYTDFWILASAARIIDAPKGRKAKVEVLQEYAPLFGRLIIKYAKHHQGRTRIMSEFINIAPVHEVLPTLYSGEIFHGYDQIHLSYAKLNRIFKREIMPSYYDALESVTGVYCPTDTKIRKLYIGSATGEGGVAARWGNYLDSKHGGNKKLQELYEREGAECFDKYFKFTLLEWFGMSYDPDKVLKREQWWKDCLSTRANGYNDN